MSRCSRYIPLVLALGATTTLSGAASGSNVVEVLTLGDSITAGFRSDSSGDANPGNLNANSVDHNLGGYRFYLDSNLDANLNLAGTTFDFIGNRQQGVGTSGFADNQHFGVYGAQASLDRTGDLGDGDGSTIPSLLTGIHNAGNTNSINAAFNNSTANPDAVLLTIGINSLPNEFSDLPFNPDVDTAIGNGITQAVNQFATLLDGDTTPTRTGLVDRLNDTNYFASDAHLFVAMIIPRVDGFRDTANDQHVNARQPQIAAEYNKQVRDELQSRMGVGGELEGRVTFVDLFSIRLDELNLQELADEFFSGESDPMDALLSAINPENEGVAGIEDDYVDWVYNSSIAFDESLFEDGGLPLTDQLVGTASRSNENPELLVDGLHPNNLGYAITAQVWENALEARYVPEPTSGLLVFLGGALLACRRPRSRVI